MARRVKILLKRTMSDTLSFLFLLCRQSFSYSCIASGVIADGVCKNVSFLAFPLAHKLWFRCPGFSIGVSLTSLLRKIYKWAASLCSLSSLVHTIMNLDLNTAVGVRSMYYHAPFECFPRKAAELCCSVDLALLSDKSNCNQKKPKEQSSNYLPAVHMRRSPPPPAGLWSESTASSNTPVFSKDEKGGKTGGRQGTLLFRFRRVRVADAQVSHRGGQSAGGPMVQPAETKVGRNDRAGRLCGPVEGSRDRPDGHLGQVHDQARQNVDHLGPAAHRNAGANFEQANSSPGIEFDFPWVSKKS
jgi:hypothetical protein